MSELAHAIEECRQLLVQGRTSLALDKAAKLLETTDSELRNEVLLHRARMHAIDEQTRKGLLTPADASAQEMQLKDSVLEFLNVIPQRLQLSAELQRSSPPCFYSDRERKAEFDVFLSHNSQDKPTVTEIGAALKDRGLSVWLDALNLTAGQQWIPELERAIASVGAAAIFVGPNGFGPWETPEMLAFLSQSAKRQLPVIPVILPGTVDQPELPLFLEQFTWVDMSKGVSSEALDRLEHAIRQGTPQQDE